MTVPPSALAALATAVLAVTTAGALALRDAPAAIDGFATRSLATARLGTANCTDWQHDSASRRRATIAALGIAATQPDPENRGPTLDQGDAYALFERACSTAASRSVLLYEIYNRAASFQSAAASQVVRPGGFGSAPHR